MFYPVFAAVLGMSFYVGSSRGWPRALWLCWPASMMVLPVWLCIEVGSLKLDLRMAAAVGVLAGMAIGPKGEGRWRWHLLDALVAVLLLSQLMTEYRIGRLGPLTGPEILRIWLLPYLM